MLVSVDVTESSSLEVVLGEAINLCAVVVHVLARV